VAIIAYFVAKVGDVLIEMVLDWGESSTFCYRCWRQV